MTQPPRRRATQRRVTFAVLAVGLGAFALLQSVVSPLLPTIRREFGTSQSAVAWVLVSYLLAATVATPILGRLADRHGKRRMLLVAFLALIVGAVGAAVAPTIHSLIIARVLQGIGGGLLPIAYSIARDTFRPERVPAVIGFMAALLAAGGAVGLVVAGPVAASIGYRWLFVLAAAVLTLAMILAWRFVPDSRPQDGARVGAVSALLLAAWLALLLLGCSLAPTHGWGSPTVIALLVAGLLFLGVWFANERSSRSALVDMRTMRLPTVWPTNIASLLFGAGMYANFAVLPQFLQTPRSTGFGFGASVTESGLMTLPQAVVMFATGCSAGLVIARFRERITLALGAALALAGYSWLGLAHDHILDIVIGTGLLGMGFGLGLASMTTIVVSSVPDDQTAVASGMNANIRTMGGAFGAAVVSSILGAQMTAGMPLERGFVYCFALLAVLMLLAVVAAVALPSQPRAARPSVRHVEVTAVPSDVGAVPVLIRDKLPRRGADEAAGPAEPVVTVTPRACDALRGGSRDG